MPHKADPDKWNCWDTVTPQEEMLAALLKRLGCGNFERQFKVEKGDDKSFWLDFAWPENLFAIEIDGHPINIARESYLKALGWNVLNLQNELFSHKKAWDKNIPHIVNIVLMSTGSDEYGKLAVRDEVVRSFVDA